MGPNAGLGVTGARVLRSGVLKLRPPEPEARSRWRAAAVNDSAAPGMGAHPAPAPPLSA